MLLMPVKHVHGTRMPVKHVHGTRASALDDNRMSRAVGVRTSVCTTPVVAGDPFRIQGLAFGYQVFLQQQVAPVSQRWS